MSGMRVGTRLKWYWIAVSLLISGVLTPAFGNAQSVATAAPQPPLSPLPMAFSNWVEKLPSGQWQLSFIDDGASREVTPIYRPVLAGFTQLTWFTLNNAMGGFGMWLAADGPPGEYRIVNVFTAKNVQVFPLATMPQIKAYVDTIPNPAGGDYIMYDSPPP